MVLRRLIMIKIKIIKDGEEYYKSPEKDIFGIDFEYENEKYVEIDYANLENADLRSANLENATLCYANLYNANLENATLCYADLENADLRSANLENADLYNANLENADLYNANLRSANLENATLCYADLYNANLRSANLENATLCYANLRSADLSYANFRSANLENADLDKKELIRKGKIQDKKVIVYKKCHNKIVTLQLQIGSIVFSINNKKCRTNKVKVIAIDDDKTEGLTIESDSDNSFIYEVGKMVEVKNFDLMYNVECSTGIHFFWTKEEAESYDLQEINNEN